MTVQLRPMTEADVSEALELWNADYVHDQAGRRRFESVLFADPRAEQAGTIAAVEGGRIVGFACCVVAREGEAWLGPYAYLKALCAHIWDEGGPAEGLVGAVVRFAAERDRQAVNVVAYSGGPYFVPGIDVRYEDKLAFFLRNGFERTGEIQDVEADLIQFTPSPRQQEAMARAAADGVSISPYEPSMLEKMRGFVARADFPNWFRPGWEAGYKTSRPTFVAIKEGAIIGYANYRPDDERGGFGTTAVLEPWRRRGIGTCLLVASMLRMKELDTPKAWAHWANTPFYLENGWHVCRRYATFRRQIGR